MNDLLKQRIMRALETLPDERAYQVLDYVEFLESRFAERQRPTGILAQITDTVEDTLRAGKLPLQAISGTMGVMDSATKIMKGLAAAGQAVVEEAVNVASSATKPPQELKGEGETTGEAQARGERREVRGEAPARGERQEARGEK